jgi:hypothetical protein
MTETYLTRISRTYPKQDAHTWAVVLEMLSNQIGYNSGGVADCTRNIEGFQNTIKLAEAEITETPATRQNKNKLAALGRRVTKEKAAVVFETRKLVGFQKRLESFTADLKVFPHDLLAKEKADTKRRIALLTGWDSTTDSTATATEVDALTAPSVIRYGN